jgi:hypothetical protein
MPVSDSDIQCYNAVNSNNDTTSTQGGAINASSQITGTTVGELIKTPLTNSNPVGGLTLTRYKKFFVANNNSTLPFTSVGFYAANLILPVVTPGVITLVSTSSADTQTLIVTGLDTAGTPNPVQINVSMTGTTPVVTSQAFSYVARMEVSGDTGTTGQISLTDAGSHLLGVIPAPPADGSGAFHSASGEISYAFDTSKNASTTSTNSTVAPASGITSFSQPYSTGTAVTVPGDGNLDAGDVWGIWLRLTIIAGLSSSTAIETAWYFAGQS